MNKKKNLKFLLPSLIVGMVIPSFSASCCCKKVPNEENKINLKIENYKNKINYLLNLNKSNFKNDEQLLNLKNEIESISKNKVNLKEKIDLFKDHLVKFDEDKYIQNFEKYLNLHELLPLLKTRIEDLKKELEKINQQEIGKELDLKFQSLSVSLLDVKSNPKFTINQKMEDLNYKKIALDVVGEKVEKLFAPHKKQAIQEIKTLVSNLLTIVKEWNTIDIDPEDANEKDDYEQSILFKIEKQQLNLKDQSFAELVKTKNLLNKIAININSIKDNNIDNLLTQLQEGFENINALIDQKNKNGELLFEITNEEKSKLLEAQKIYKEIKKDILNYETTQVIESKNKLDQIVNDINLIINKYEMILAKDSLKFAIEEANLWLSDATGQAAGISNYKLLEIEINKAKNQTYVDSLTYQQINELVQNIEKIINNCMLHYTLRKSIDELIINSNEIIEEWKVLGNNQNAQDLQQIIDQNKYINDENLTIQELEIKEKKIKEAKDKSFVSLYKTKFYAKFTEATEVFENLKTKGLLDDAEELDQLIKTTKQKIIDGEYGSDNYKDEYQFFVDKIEQYKKLL